MQLDFALDVPAGLTGPALDARLAGGWFRSGPVVFRSPLLAVDGRVRQLRHIRVPVTARLRSRNLRRVLRRNRGRFRVVEGPVAIDDAARRLYHATRPRFVDFVLDGLDGVVASPAFPTRQLAVFDGDRLVAVSYFDPGHRALASILGLHDPAYARYGLGTYTMLEELAWAHDRGFAWYYPGYVVPGMPGFDYKLRLGAVEVLTDAGWEAFGPFARTAPLAERAEQEMVALERGLAARGVATERRIYPCSWAGWVDATDEDYLRGMWHLRLDRAHDGHPVVVEHLPHSGEYVAAAVRELDDFDPFENLHRDRALEAACEMRLLGYVQVLRASTDVEAVVAAL